MGLYILTYDKDDSKIVESGGHMTTIAQCLSNHCENELQVVVVGGGFMSICTNGGE